MAIRLDLRKFVPVIIVNMILVIKKSDLSLDYAAKVKQLLFNVFKLILGVG